MTQKILFEIESDYDLKDIKDLIGDYTTIEEREIVVSEEQLAVLLLAYKGAQFWYKNGHLHRDNDLPAAIYADGSQMWYQNGIKHRDNDLPAAIYAHGTQHWYQNGKLHRDNNLPAIICADGTQIFYQNGKPRDISKMRQMIKGAYYSLVPVYLQRQHFGLLSLWYNRLVKMTKPKFTSYGLRFNIQTRKDR